MTNAAASPANHYPTAVAAYAADLPAASRALTLLAVHAPIGIDSDTRRASLRLAADCFILRGGCSNTARVFVRLGLRAAGFDA